MYWSKKEESFIPCNLPKISTAKTKVAEPIKEYVMQSNLLFLKEYKTIIKPNNNVTVEVVNIIFKLFKPNFFKDCISLFSWKFK